MKRTNIYLNFNGNCGEAFAYYKSIFGGEFESIQRFKDLPPEIPQPSADGNKIMHISLPLGENRLMGCDVPDSDLETVLKSDFHISIDTESKEETDRMFEALSSGGKETMPLADTFWGSYFGMCKDKFGIQWMVSYDPNENQSGENS